MRSTFASAAFMTCALTLAAGCRGMFHGQGRLPPCPSIEEAADGRPLPAGGSGVVFAHDATLRGFSLQETHPVSNACAPSKYVSVVDREEIGIALVRLPEGEYAITSLSLESAADPGDRESVSGGDLPLRFTVSRAGVTVLGDVACVRGAPRDRCRVSVATLGRGRQIVVDTIAQRAHAGDSRADVFATWTAAASSRR